MKVKLDNLGKVSVTVEKDYWGIGKTYNRLVIVEERDTFTTYISRKVVPAGVFLSNRDYWIPLGKRSATIQVKDFTILDSDEYLPTTQENYEGPYLIDGYGYFWVGTGGDVQSGHYQKVQIQGDKGDTGLSFFDWYKITTNQPNLTETEFINIMKGRAGTKGDPGKDGETPYIGEDGNWWIGNTNTHKPARGEKGEAGEDGKDGLDGTNGTNGKNGKDGYTPYIGTNGNWWINGIDTGKPSRGEDGTPGGGSSSSVNYYDEDATYIRITPISSAASPTLTYPTETTITKTLIQLSQFPVEIPVIGSNLLNDINVYIDTNSSGYSNNKYWISKDSEYVDNTLKNIVLTNTEINSGNAKIRLFRNSTGLSGSETVTLIFTSPTNEFTTRVVRVRYLYQIPANNSSDFNDTEVNNQTIVNDNE